MLQQLIRTPGQSINYVPDVVNISWDLGVGAVALPTGWQAGDTLVFFHTYAVAGTAGTPTGYTALQTDARMHISYKIATASETSPTGYSESANNLKVLVCLRETPDPAVTQASVVNTANSTSITLNSLAANNYTIVLYFITVGSGTSTVAWGTPDLGTVLYTSDKTILYDGVIVGYQTKVTTPATITGPTVTIASTQALSGGMVSFQGKSIIT